MYCCRMGTLALFYNEYPLLTYVCAGLYCEYYKLVLAVHCINELAIM